MPPANKMPCHASARNQAALADTTSADIKAAIEAAAQAAAQAERSRLLAELLIASCRVCATDAVVDADHMTRTEYARRSRVSEAN